MYRQKLLLFLLFFFTVFNVYSQFSADPHHQLYRYLDVWFGKGYIKELPSFRPIPEIVWVDILDRVIKVGSFRDKVIAEEYRAKLDKITVDSRTFAVGNLRSTQGTDTSQLDYFARASSGISIYSFVGSPLVSMAASFELGVQYKSLGAHDLKSFAMKPFVNEYISHLERAVDSSIRYTDGLGGAAIDFAYNSLSSMTIGTKDVFFHSGLMQRSIGLFHDDGIVVSPLAKQSPNFFVYWKVKPVAFTWAFFVLSAQRQYSKFDVDETTGEITTQKDQGLKLNKYYYYNSLTWYITEDIEFQIFESIMFGDFSLNYLAPLKLLYAVDSLSNFAAGNLTIGLSFSFRVHENVRIPISIVGDDLDAISLFSLDFNSTKKIAVETGVEWYPENIYFKSLKLNYKIMGPYTYTHPVVSSSGLNSYSTEYNTTNHTHAGRPLASSLPPSSHRLSLDSTITPLSFLETTFFFHFQQHNNPSEGVLNGPLNDGSILDDGYYSIYDSNLSGNSYKDRNFFDFLTGTIEHKFTVGATINILDVRLSKSLLIYGNVHYQLNYTINKGSKAGINELSNDVSAFLGLKIEIY